MRTHWIVLSALLLLGLGVLAGQRQMLAQWSAANPVTLYEPDGRVSYTSAR